MDRHKSVYGKSYSLVKNEAKIMYKYKVRWKEWGWGRERKLFFFEGGSELAKISTVSLFRCFSLSFTNMMCMNLNVHNVSCFPQSLWVTCCPVHRPDYHVSFEATWTQYCKLSSNLRFSSVCIMRCKAWSNFKITFWAIYFSLILLAVPNSPPLPVIVIHRFWLLRVFNYISFLVV